MKKTLLIALILLLAFAAWLIINHNLRRWQKQMQELVREIEKLKEKTVRTMRLVWMVTSRFRESMQIICARL